MNTLNSFDIIDHHYGELSAIAADYNIDWGKLSEVINFDGRGIKRGIELDKSSRGKVFAIANEWTAPDGNTYPTITFKTFKHGDIQETWNGYKAHKELAENTTIPTPRPARVVDISAAEKAERENQQKINRFEKFHAEFQTLPRELGKHPYLIKQFGDLAEQAAQLMDLRYGHDKRGKFIAYALSNRYGKVVGYQRIYERNLYGRDTNKDFVFLPDSKNGSFYIIGQYEDGKPLFVAEGAANAIIVSLATGYPCVIALDAGNLPNVVKSLKALDYKKLIIAADNDQKDLIKNGNTGLYKAILAAREHGARVFIATDTDSLKLADKTIPYISPNTNLSASHEACNFDFIDLLKKHGLAEVQNQLKLSSNPCQVTIAKNQLEILLQDLPIMPKQSRAEFVKTIEREVVRLAPLKPLEASIKHVRNTLPDYVPVAFLDVARLFEAKKADAIKLYKFTDSLPIFSCSDNDKLAGYLLERGGLYVLNWGMSRGKTLQMAALAKLCAELGLKFGYIAHRIALITNSCARLGIESYEQLKGYMLADVDAMGICINSLEKEHFQLFFNSLDVLCIDEIRQVLESIGVGSVDKTHRELLHGILLELIKRTPLVIGADADIDQKTLDFIKSSERDVMQVSGGLSHINDTVIQSTDYKKCWDLATSAAISGLKTLIQCDSIKETETLEIALRGHGLRVIVINSETRPEAEQADFLSNPDAYLVKHKPDVVLTSPTISSGFSIELDYFETHFMLMQGVLAPTEIIQTAGRYRPAKNIIIGFKDNFSQPSITAEQMILGDIVAAGRMGITDTETGLAIHYQFTAFDKFSHAIRTQIEQSKVDYINKTLLIFEDKGYAVEPLDSTEAPVVIDKIDRKVMAKTAESERVSLVKSAADIDSAEAKRREKSNALLLKDRYELERHQIIKQLAVSSDDLAIDDIEFWDRGKGAAKIKKIEAVQHTIMGCESYDQQQHEIIKSVSIMYKATSIHFLYGLLFEAIGIDKQTLQGSFTQTEAIAGLKLLQAHNDECMAAKLGNFSKINEKYAVRSVGKLLAQLGLGLDFTGHHDKTYFISAETSVRMRGYLAARKSKGIHSLKLTDKTIHYVSHDTNLSASHAVCEA